MKIFIILALYAFIPATMYLLFAWFEWHMDRTIVRGMQKLVPYLHLFEMNRLYKCEDCGLYYRKYQLQLYLVIKEKRYDTCPHCQRELSRRKEMKKQPAYLDMHPSCPKLKGLKELHAMKKSLRLYAENNKIKAKQKEFEQLQQRTQEDPLKWLKNIQGDEL